MKGSSQLVLLCVIVLLIQVDAYFKGRRWQRKKKLEAACNDPPEKGSCYASIVRWYFDPESNQCKTFTYGGCGGNLNRFFSQQQCENICIASDGTTSHGPICPRRRRCFKRCPFGYVRDTSGCRVCECAPDPNPRVCPALQCPANLTCPGGLRMDKTGCTLCECACPLTGCLLKCEHGAAHDERGCLLCACRDKPVDCKRINCLMECPFGKKKDADGCELCQCLTKEEVCGMAICAMHCPHGFKTDSRGCDTCQCKSADNAETHCPEITCLNECAFGRAKDRAGCPTCTCNPLPTRDSLYPDCPRQPVITCRMYCPHEFKTDAEGCPICQCADPPAASLLPARHVKDGAHVSHHGGAHVEHHGQSCTDIRATCRMHCPGGFARDEKGCEVCACESLVVTSCRPNVCRKHCAFGYQLDRRGCEICVCRPEKRSCSDIKVTCLMHCPSGFARDESGCEICRCAEPAAVVLKAQTVG